MELFYFTAPWCVPCRNFGPVMDLVTSVPVFKVNVDDNPTKASEMGVMSIPTVVLTVGSREVSRFSGARSLEYVNDFVTLYTGMRSAS